MAPIAGKPLIAWTLEAAANSHALERTIVSTDDDEIADVCRSWGAEVPFDRPASMAQDDSSHIDVVVHALEWLATNEGYRPEYVMLLQPTSPLRTAEDIDAAAALARERAAAALVSVTASHDHPYLARRIVDNGTLEVFMPCEIAYPRRQSLPPAYALNGAIYLNQRATLLETGSFEQSGTIPYVMPPERSVQIDSPWDLHLCELVLKERRSRSESTIEIEPVARRRSTL